MYTYLIIILYRRYFLRKIYFVSEIIFWKYFDRSPSTLLGSAPSELIKPKLFSLLGSLLIRFNPKIQTFLPCTPNYKIIKYLLCV